MFVDSLALFQWPRKLFLRDKFVLFTKKCFKIFFNLSITRLRPVSFKTTFLTKRRINFSQEFPSSFWETSVDASMSKSVNFRFSVEEEEKVNSWMLILSSSSYFFRSPDKGVMQGATKFLFQMKNLFLLCFKNPIIKRENWMHCCLKNLL